jgi:hypothetical protein
MILDLAAVFCRMAPIRPARCSAPCESAQIHPSSLNQIDTALFLTTEEYKAAAFAKRLLFLRRRQ